jgi:hypothetical protein
LTYSKNKLIGLSTRAQTQFTHSYLTMTKNHRNFVFYQKRLYHAKGTNEHR